MSEEATKVLLRKHNPVNNGPDYSFWCPACKEAHYYWTSATNRLGGNWTFNGNFEKPTFQPSLKLSWDRWTPPVTSENLEQWRKQPWQQTKVHHVCHLFVTNGQISYCTDCTHEMAGKLVDMVPF